METLIGCFFNAIWLVCSVVFGWLLWKVFALLPLPFWLSLSIVVALSFCVGLMGMILFIGRTMGESWHKCREEALMLLRHLVAPVIASAVVAVVSYYLLHALDVTATAEQVFVGLIAFIFYFCLSTIMTDRLDKQQKKEREAWLQQAEPDPSSPPTEE